MLGETWDQGWRLWEGDARGGDDEDGLEYLLNDIGPLLYVFEPEWRRQREQCEISAR